LPSGVGHSIETAVVNIVKDVLSSSDGGKVSAVFRLDLSAVFNIFCGETLLSLFETDLGVKSTVLSWSRSYLSGRRFSRVPLSYLPQGLVTGPLLFCLHT